MKGRLVKVDHYRSRGGIATVFRRGGRRERGLDEVGAPEGGARPAEAPPAEAARRPYSAAELDCQPAPTAFDVWSRSITRRAPYLPAFLATCFCALMGAHRCVRARIALHLHDAFERGDGLPVPKLASPDALSQPHDRLFQWTFSQRNHAAGLLRAVLPKEVIAHVHWPTFVDEHPNP